jgi:hypothetical protein
MRRPNVRKLADAVGSGLMLGEGVGRPFLVLVTCFKVADSSGSGVDISPHKSRRY